MGKYFGTDGFRGTANDKLTAKHAFRIGRFIGQYPNGRKNKILIARDTRISGGMLVSALIAGIVSSGSDVYDEDISTTPSVSYLVSKLDFDFGVMVSASHNPYFDNGIKIFNSKGFKVSEELEEQIEMYIDAPFDILAMPKNERVGRLYNNLDLKSKYVDFLVSKATTSYKGIKVALDCANGASYEIAKRVFSRLEADIKYYNDKPDGININEGCGSTHIKFLEKVFKSNNYDIGFAFDGDADRVLAYSSNLGLVDGDALMYLNARSLKHCHALKENTIVLTIMSNLGLKKALAQKGIFCVETKVGDKYVQACLESEGYSFGGEQSGHIIFYDDLSTGDGILSAIKTLNLLAETGSSIEYLLRDFRSYPQAHKNVTVTNKDAVMNNAGLQQLIDELSSKLGDEGRVVVRPSGTEPLVRIMCEASEKDICEKVCGDIKDYIESLGY